jgi:methylthioribose-1-phosphate isomerase
MKIQGNPYRSIWAEAMRRQVFIIDQTKLPHAFEVKTLRSMAEAADAIRNMEVRGAPLIGVTAAFGVALAMSSDASDAALDNAIKTLNATRPTAVNLAWALERVRKHLAPLSPARRVSSSWIEAGLIAEEDVEINRRIGVHGAKLIHELAQRHKRPINILTHCNAGWVATVDWGTALSAVYHAHDAGMPIHVWVDETRPRNQGLLTAWELREHGVPHTLITDNAGGHLMQQGKVDMVIVGADRVSRRGDVCNKIGTYLKALAAKEHGIPFYAAVPSPTIDWTIEDALRDIEIEERDPNEVRTVAGLDAEGRPARVAIAPADSPVSNPAFDVTPARCVRGIITERGVAEPARLAELFGIQPAEELRKTPEVPVA